MPINAEDVCQTSKKDPVLRNVMKCIRTDSWVGAEKNSALKPFYMRRDELTLDEGCVLWAVGW